MAGTNKTNSTNKISIVETIDVCKKQRNSSVELFRILATFLVLIVHLNGWMAGGLVDWNDSNIPAVHKVSQLIIQSLTVVCVNCFLIISGWYGLKLKYSSICKIWKMLVGIYVPFYIVACFLGVSNISITGIAINILAFPCENYFVQNYLMLLFISPVLNAFIDTCKEKLTVFAISLFSIEVVMESVFGNKSLHIEDGYSLFHFITMYMLARAAFMHKDQIMRVKKRLWILGYFACATSVCLLHFTPYRHNWAYSNPIVIIESFMLFFPFIYCTTHNRIVNWIAGNAFGVYIIQVTNPVIGFLFKIDHYAINHFTYTSYLLLMLSFCILFFAGCIVYNTVAQRIVSYLLKPLERHYKKHI